MKLLGCDQFSRLKKTKKKKSKEGWEINWCSW